MSETPAAQGPKAQRPELERMGYASYRSVSPHTTRWIGEQLGALLEPGDVVILTGQLAAGKTCLVGGAAAALGDSSSVTSPTFTVVHLYDGGRIPLYHIDLYRLNDPRELEDVGLYDLLEGDGACLIEWGELFEDQLGDDHLDLCISRADDMPAGDEPARIVTFAPHGARAEHLAAALDAALAAGSDVPTCFEDGI